MNELIWLGRFKGGAAGNLVTISLPVPPEPDAYLMLQEAAGGVAAFIGFSRAGVIEVNRQEGGIWQAPAFVPLPKASSQWRLVLRISADCMILLMNDLPLGAFPLGSPADRITGLCGFAIAAKAKIEIDKNISPDFSLLTRKNFKNFPLAKEGVRRGLVVSPYLLSAVADALNNCDEVVVVAPMPWHMAMLALVFSEQITSGRLLPLGFVPARRSGQRYVMMQPDEPSLIGGDAISGKALAPQALDEVEVQDFAAALGPLDVIYHTLSAEAYFADMLESHWGQVREKVLVAPLAESETLLENGCQRFFIGRVYPLAGYKFRPQRWLSASILRRMLDNMENDRSGLVVVGSC